MLFHFFQAIRSLTFFQMDEEEWTRRRKMSKFIPFHKNHNGEVFIDFDAQSIQKMKPFPEIKKLDAYGSTVFDVHGTPVTLLNTYGEEDKNWVRADDSIFTIITLCIIHGNTIECADVISKRSMLPRKDIQLVHHLTGKIPLEFNGVEFSGKRAFYYYYHEMFVSLRVSKEVYERTPDELKHKEAEEWASGPRIKVFLGETE